ncbi:AbfB domain-containing protein [Kineococcus sp. DHX-1]|uniref:AbfB domain-containing protein n=1 Tax=Kineococcus sp. DHX-1 TaxID=3349638 RepID=UPI0036D3B6ED
MRGGLLPAPALPLTPGRSLGFEALNFPGYRLMHENFAVFLRQAGAGSAGGVTTDTSWVVRPGLADGAGVSFEATTWPGYYLTAPTGGGALGLVRNDGSAGFAGRATFAAVAGAAGQGSSFQVWSDRTLQVRHQDFQVFAQKADGSDLGRADSSFVLRSGLFPTPAV